MPEQGFEASEVHHHDRHDIELFVDGVAVTTHEHRLNGLQIRELGTKEAEHRMVTGHVNRRQNCHGAVYLKTAADRVWTGDLLILPERGR